MTATHDRPLRILIAEDHTIVREGLLALLTAQPDLEVVAEVANGQDAVERCRELTPDVALMDLSMPGLNGVDATARIRRECPGTRVLVLSMHGDEAHVRPAMRAGASGYLLKGSGLSDLVAALRAVAAGNTFVSPEAARILVEPPPEGDDPYASPLTAREREILALVADGRSSPQIATLLEISPKTVENHRASIMRKLGIHDLAGLVRYAVRVGLVRP